MQFFCQLVFVFAEVEDQGSTQLHLNLAQVGGWVANTQLTNASGFTWLKHAESNSHRLNMQGPGLPRRPRL